MVGVGWRPREIQSYALVTIIIVHCPKKKFVNGNVFLDGRKCLSIHEEMFLWVLITSMERKKLSC